MSKRYRLALMILSLVVLLAVGFYFNGNFSFAINDFWFSSGLLLLILLSLVDQPFFSKDCNIFVNAVTAALSLLLVPANERSVAFWIFLEITIYLIISSYILMWLRSRELSQEHILMQIFARINRQLGKPETIFSAFFLWGAIWVLYIRKTGKQNCFRLGAQPAAPVTIVELSSIYSAIRRNSSAYLNFTLMLPPS